MSSYTSRRFGGMRAGVAVMAAASALGAAGCEATFQPAEPFSATYERQGLLMRAQVVPPNIWAYPHVDWGGSFAYLVDGVWYFPTPEGWMVFRSEPVELSRQRTRMGQGRFRAPFYGYPSR